jgi:hypothetical protein
LVAAVPERSPATLLVDPGTTVEPVAPGVLLFAAAAGFESAVPLPEGFAFGVVVVTELLPPMLPVGLLLWAKAITGVARSAAASMEILSVEDIYGSLFGYGITAKPGYSH